MDGAGNGWAVFTAGGLRARKHDPSTQWQATQSIGSMIVTAFTPSASRSAVRRARSGNASSLTVKTRYRSM